MFLNRDDVYWAPTRFWALGAVQMPLVILQTSWPRKHYVHILQRQKVNLSEIIYQFTVTQLVNGQMRIITGFPVCSRIKKYSLWNKQKTWLWITFVKTHLSSRLYKWYIFVEEILLPISYFSLVPQFGKSLLTWFSFLGFFFFKTFFFFMRTIFKVSVEFVTILFLIKILFFWPWSMWDLTVLARDQTCVPCIGGWIFNHWNTRKVPRIICLKVSWSP